MDYHKAAQAVGALLSCSGGSFATTTRLHHIECAGPLSDGLVEAWCLRRSRDRERDERQAHHREDETTEVQLSASVADQLPSGFCKGLGWALFRHRIAFKQHDQTR